MLEKKLDKIGKYLKNTIKVLGLGVLLYHGASQIRYASNYIEDRINPSSEFAEFEKNTGIKITGYKDEDCGLYLYNYLEVIKEENVTSKELNAIFLEHPNYFEKSLPEQLSKLIFTPYSGCYNSLTNNVTLNIANPSTLRHELIHVKTFKNPHKRDLIREWSELAKDSAGNSYYLNSAEQVISDIRMLEKLVKHESNYESLGFVSDYSLTNVYEDIAEFVTDASEDLSNFTQKSEKNPKFKKKMELAIKYNLLPKESLDYLELKQLFYRWADLKDGGAFVYNSDKSYDESKRLADSIRTVFLDKSEQFLKDNPQSIYAGGLLNTRAQAYAKYFSRMGNSWSKESEQELKKALLFPSNGWNYLTTLFFMEEIHYQMYSQYGDNNPYKLATNSYINRKKSFDLSLLTIGVNDELMKIGELDKLHN